MSPDLRTTRAAGAVRRALVVVAVFAVLLVILVWGERIQGWVVVAYAALSGVAVLMYRADKAAATNGGWRTAESTLHGVALLGGWPGALVARRVFRHKTVKQPFRTIFWGTVVANCAALAWLAYGMPSPLP